MGRRGLPGRLRIRASGCYVPVPGSVGDFGPFAPAGGTNTSAGRFPDGVDTDSNCSDFLLQAATTLSPPSANGATNIKVASVAGFGAGQTIMIDTGANLETAVIATVGTAGATTVRAATAAGATVIPVASAAGFIPGQTITIGSGADYETAVVASATFRGGATITVAAPTHACARSRCTDLRHRHHPCLCIDQGACQRGTGHRQRSHARRAQQILQEASLNVPAELI